MLRNVCTLYRRQSVRTPDTSGIRQEPSLDFRHVWEKVEPLIEGLPFVAHNSPFDSSCLRKAHEAYGMRYPEYEFFDTLKAARRHFGRSLPNHQLHTVSEACGYILKDHHHALADAEACAYIAMKIL